MSRVFPQTRAALAAEEGEASVASPGLDITGLRAEARAAAQAEPREEVGSVEDIALGPVMARLYLPDSASGGPLPLIVHCHGGGFVFNDIEVHDASVRRLVNRSGLAVLSVDYRLAPEHRHPAPTEDVEAALRWVSERGASYALDPERVSLHGDSAGAALALAAALRHPGRFCALALIYPFIDSRCRSESWAAASGLFDRSEGEWYWAQYAASPADHDDVDFSPYAASDLSTLPPTLVMTADADPCCDEGEELAHRAAEAGVEVVATRYLGVGHGFWRHPEIHAAEPLMRQVAGFLRLHSEPGLRT